MAESTSASSRAVAGRRRSAAEAAFITLAAAVVMLPVVVWGPASGHDATVHVVWLEHFGRTLAAGCWYPRWLNDVNHGLGNPTFIFYFPAFAYAATLVRTVVPDPVAAIWLVSAAALWASGLAMALFLRPHCSAFGVVVGAVAYMATPYRLLDLYERAAFPEAMSFVWPPLVLAAIDRHGRGGSGVALAVIAAGTGGLAYTHHGAVAIFLPLVVAYAVATGPWRARLARLGAVALGIAVGAATLLPAIAERAHVIWGFLPYQISFLLRGGEAPVSPFVARLHMDAAYYATVAFLGVGVAWQRRTPAAIALAATAAGACLLSTAISSPAWELLPPLQMIDLPWRWLGVASFAAAALLAFQADSPGRGRAVAVAMTLFGVALGVVDWVMPARFERAPMDMAVARLDGPDRRHTRPRWAPIDLPAARPPMFIGGTARLVSAGCAHEEYELSGRREATFEIDTFYYPGWVATIDGAPAAIRPEIAAGRISLRVPKGRHRVRFDFVDTPVRAWSVRLTLASLVVVAGLVVLPGRQRGRG